MTRVGAKTHLVDVARNLSLRREHRHQRIKTINNQNRHRHRHDVNKEKTEIRNGRLHVEEVDLEIKKRDMALSRQGQKR